MKTDELEIAAPVLLILTDRESDKFWSRVNKNGPLPDPAKYPSLAGPCWEWIAGRDAYNYGSFRFRGGNIKTHRLSWMIHRGKITVEICVLHKCDNPPCMNPDHLFRGTKKDNSQDMSCKGRSGAHQHPDTLSRGDAHYSRIQPHRLARGNRHGTVTKPETIRRGSANGWAKLTESEVLAIRSLYAAGERSCVSIAGDYKISKTTVQYIVRRLTWKHLL